MPQPFVSLIICSYNRPALLRATVSMALAQVYPTLEIIVVDQTATNPPEIQAFFDALPGEYVQYCRLLVANLPVARNHGLQMARGEVLIFIDDDVQIPPNFVERHVAAHRWPPTVEGAPVGGVSGLAQSPRHPTWESLVTHMAAQGLAGHLRRGDVIPVPWLSGCNMSFRRVVLETVGGFDPYFTGSGWGEDVDISLAVRAAGYRVVMNTGIELFHKMATTGGGESRALRAISTRQRERTGFWLYILHKHWRVLGVDETVRRGWRLYREYAGSRALYQREGRQVVLERHRDFIRLWYNAMSAISEKRT